MCGLLGSFSQHPEPAFDKCLRAALHSLGNRGPDDHGLVAFKVAGGQLALGHTRLSIIDLSSRGHQPMSSTDGRYYIVFNGEIYNYRELRQELKSLGHAFHTDSDTEVLLEAWSKWGLSGLRRLTGMFAFAVYDRHVHTLTLIRDAFGIKPLFYQQDSEGFCFASEISALLLLLPRKPGLNLQRAYDYLVFGSYDNGADTFYEGIHHLPPGHWLTIDLQTLHIEGPQRWWWPSIDERADLSFDDAAAQLREMFLENIRLHLRSDVPLGAALSGGVDSSAVVCAIRHLQPEMPIHTFTFVAPGTAVDEERWADIVTAHVGAQAHRVVVDPSDLARDLDDMIRAQGEPFCSTSIYAQYRVFKAAREAGVIVTLDGQGADESLAGYSGYPLAYLRSLVDCRQYVRVPFFLHAWSRWPGRNRRQALLILASLMTPAQLRSIGLRALGRDPAPCWLDQEWLDEQSLPVAPEPPEPSPECSGRRLMEQMRLALTGSGLSALLRHGDRNSMRWSVESRVPFLTCDVVEFLLTLPESYLLSPNAQTKRIFRAAMRGIVPDSILNRRDKIGFETPEYDWLRCQGEQIQDWLSAAEELPILNASASMQEISNILTGQQPFSPQVWRLINYCRWAQLSL